MGEPRKNRFRIESDGTRLGTRVTDVDSGVELHQTIARISIEVSGQMGDDNYVCLEVVSEIDATVEGEVRRLRWNQDKDTYEYLGSGLE